VPIDDVYQVTLTSSVSNQVNMNTVAFRRTVATAIDATAFQTVADDLKELHRQNQSGGLAYVSWRARQVRGTAVTWPSGPDCTPVGGLWFEGTFTAPVAGVESGDLLPQQCAMVTTIRTGTIGRRYRGRFYAGGWSEVSQTNGVWITAHLSAIQTKWNTLFTKYVTDAATTGWQVGVWSYRIASGCAVVSPGGSHTRVESPNPGAAFTVASAFVTRPPVYTQRRRVVGVGI
jgi:hypothetical protein